MPTTPKGLPYPAVTAPPNVPADLQALADALDFTRVQLLTAAGSGLVNASQLSAYPIGISVLSLSSGEGSAGGWPGGTSCHIWTFKPTTTRAWQWLYMNATVTRAWSRALQPDPGPHAQWAVIVDNSSSWTPIPAASGHTSAAFSRLRLDGRTVELWGTITKTAPPLVRATTIGSIVLAHRPSTSYRLVAALGNAISGPGTSSLTIDGSTGALALASDATSIGSHGVVYLDGISYPLL